MLSGKKFEKDISGWNITTKIGLDLPNILMGKVGRFGAVLANGLGAMASFRRLGPKRPPPYLIGLTNRPNLNKANLTIS